jgi:hypothetical protein
MWVGGGISGVQISTHFNLNTMQCGAYFQNASESRCVGNISGSSFRAFKFPPVVDGRFIENSTWRIGLWAKGKGEVPVLFNWAPRHEGLLGGGGIAPRIIWPRHMEVNGQLHAPGRFIPRERAPPRCPLDRRLGGPQSRSGRGSEENNSKPPPGIEP